MKKGHIFFISWVAGAGKWTLIKQLLEKNIPNLELSISCKTRDFRAWETQGVDYHKLSVSEFQQAIENNEFLEYNFVHNQNYYGTRLADVIDNGINKWKIILTEMDILALPKLKYTHHNIRDDYTYIFLDLPVEKIKQRMKKRWDDVSGKDFENRIQSAEKEINLKNLADHVIDADRNPNQVLKDVYEIISKKI